jgi:hypothetical protein
MPDSSDPLTTEPQTGEVVKTLAEIALKDEEFRKSLSRRISYAILATTALATIELTIGIPIISLRAVPLIAILVVALIAPIEDWVRKKRPSTVFYICPEEGIFISIKRSSHPKYRKFRSCPDCGCELIRRCQRGKHYIVSSNADQPDTPLRLDGFCPFCNPSLPKPSKAYLPMANKPADD